MTQANKEILKSYAPTFVGYLITLIVFAVATSYSIGKAEERFISQFKEVDARVSAVSLADYNHHQTAMDAVRTSASERILMLKPMADHIADETITSRALQDTLTKMSQELTALRVGQENTNRRIDEMRSEFRK